MYTAITPPGIRRAREVYTAVTRRVRAVNGRVTCRVHGRVHGRVTCRVPVTRRPCTRPVNTSSHAKTARTRPYNGRAVYTARTRPSMGVNTARLHHPCTRDVYTGVYGPCIRPCTRHVYGRVHVSTCTGHLHGRKRPSTRPYTAVHGRITCRVYGPVGAVCKAVFGPVH